MEPAWRMLLTVGRGGDSLTIRTNPIPGSPGASHGRLTARFAPSGRWKSICFGVPVRGVRVTQVQRRRSCGRASRHSKCKWNGLVDVPSHRRHVPTQRWGGFLMRAILRTKFGGPDVLVIREVPEPEPKDGHAVIQVKAF